jgi:hypothetical protein
MSEARGADAEMEIQWLESSEADTSPPPGEDEIGEAEQPDSQEKEGPTDRPRPPVPTSPSHSRPRDRSGTGPAPQRPKSRPAPTPSPSPVLADERTVVAAERPSLAEVARRHRNPLIFLAVGLLVLGTVSYRQWRSKREHLPGLVAIGRTEGLVALDEGRIDTAHQLLSKAKNAVEALHDQVEGADEVRQAAEQAEILANLTSERLEKILAEASKLDPAEWPSRFATYYKGRAIVLIDATIDAVPGEGGSDRYDLDYRIFPDGPAVGGRAPSRGRIDLTGVKLFERLKPKVGDKVRFGAVLASFRFDSASEEWQVGLEPESAVQMSRERPLQALGILRGSEPLSAEGRP